MEHDRADLGLPDGGAGEQVAEMRLGDEGNTRLEYGHSLAGDDDSPPTLDCSCTGSTHDGMFEEFGLGIDLPDCTQWAEEVTQWSAWPGFTVYSELWQEVDWTVAGTDEAETSINWLEDLDWAGVLEDCQWSAVEEEVWGWLLNPEAFEAGLIGSQ
ncbi:hypothetical protein EVJ58_g7455 [Rhodofomes roseus]|uniref:Uncharacterized protein n=1 Tax=Rhodofomes roseus TaxID=34475 RepID=A0A4Y9Y4M9_9APHY|nr:hypothetical protein EVJ58_g7455 [Rhodofomes roseus]